MYVIPVRIRVEAFLTLLPAYAHVLFPYDNLPQGAVVRVSLVRCLFVLLCVCFEVCVLRILCQVPKVVQPGSCHVPCVLLSCYVYVVKGPRIGLS